MKPPYRLLSIAALTASALLTTNAFCTSADEPIKPLPAHPLEDLAAPKVALGERLFNDPRFSQDGSVACSSCHDIHGKGGADGRRVSSGAGNAQGVINAPSVLNAAHNFRQFWDGRAATLEEQIGFVITNPVEFASDWDAVLGRLAQDSALLADFQQVYPEGITQASVSDALASFQRSLPSPSRFDRYLQGDGKALGADEIAGYERFKSYGCVACHQGVNVGGNMYQLFGVMGDYFKDRGNVQKEDLGRFNVTGLESDRYVFKVPSLRNVALTAPYFHDGSSATLESAVDVMFKYQLGRTAPEEDRRLIVSFLRSLTGEAYESKP